MINRLIPGEKAVQLTEMLKDSGAASYDSERHRLEVTGTDSESVFFRLPVNLHSPENLKPVNYVILLIQSGSCSMGYYENLTNINHKVFKSYMVRQKQGKSQIKHLKTKGKSRAGSRVRLGETVEFFENINERLQEYFGSYKIDRIAISCSKILIPYLFNSKVECPFDKKDERLFKIPKHVEVPNHEVMNNIHQFLLKGELIYPEEQQPYADKLLKNLFS